MSEIIGFVGMSHSPFAMMLPPSEPGDPGASFMADALRVARAFHGRLEQMPTPGDPPAPPSGLTVTQHG